MATSKGSSSASSNGTPPDDTASTDAQQKLAEPPADAGSTNGTAGAAKAASEPAQAPDEGSDEKTGDGTSDNTSDNTSEDDAENETPDGPQVVNDQNGQRVLMPDGSTVTTRSHNLPMTNVEQAKFEETHTGDQPRYALVPGDAGYSSYSDPAVPDSHRAQMIEREIASYAERVLTDVKAYVSPTWHSLKGLFEEELHHAIETGETSGKVRL